MKPATMAVAAGIAVAVAAGVLAATTWYAGRQAHALAEDFCAATPAGTPARDVTIRALDRQVQVRTDIEPGALVVRFEAWGLSRAAGECRMTLQGDYVASTRLVRL